MVSSIQQEASAIYNKLLHSRVLCKQWEHLEFVTQPKEIIFRENKLILYRFQPTVKIPALTPVLLVFALINRPEILDFSTENSFIKGLLDAGRDVYLIDWGYPSAADKDLALSTYIVDYLRACVQQIHRKSRQPHLDLLGICQGGVLSLCYASVFPQDIRQLVLISTPIDFQSKGDILGRWARQVAVDDLIKRQGNVPGPWLARFFESLRPFQTQGKKYLALLDQLARPQPDLIWIKKFFLIEKWLLDTPDHAGRAFAEFITLFYQQNSFIQGKFMLGNACIDLKSLTMPILNVMARDDHIVPPRASRILGKYVSSTAYSQQLVPAGHIGMYVSQKTSKRLSQMIASWLQKGEAMRNG